MHSIQDKIAALKHIYKVYDETVSGENFFCRKGCAHCCTANVALTTLEMYYLIEAVEDKSKIFKHYKIEELLSVKRFQPKVTINQMAAMSLQDQDPPEEEADPDCGKCPILMDNECPEYEFRPFACRAMVSVNDCEKVGIADMPPFILTLNNVIMQYIEHVDAGGYYGNFVDIYKLMDNDTDKQAYLNGNLPPIQHPLLPNRLVPALMAPPEHRDKIGPILEKLNQVPSS